MEKGSKSGCKSSSRGLFKDKAKSRVDDLQGVFMDLQSALKESRASDVSVLEEKVHQMLCEWKAELDEASPASSLHSNSVDSLNLSSDIRRLLQLCEEEDDATSALASVINLKLEPEPEDHGLQAGENALSHEDYFVNQVPQCHGLNEVDHCKETPSMELHHAIVNSFDVTGQWDYHQFDLQQDVSHNIFLDFDGTDQYAEDAEPQIECVLPRICPPPSAFMGPRCALWDCNRPAQGSKHCQDYCSTFHADLALTEGQPGMTPIVRPGGIDLKDSPLFAALNAKTQGKAVGIPECEGAATTKSPWNAPELFDLSLLGGESIREWLFFDKPRRAFESGNRKQRSLPDYSGRGWHESRKQVMKEFEGLKRSYYMDPQPSNNIEWHIFEYKINNTDAYALYRLEFKIVDSKKSPKGKLTSDPLVDLQQQMGKLTAGFPPDNKRSIRGRAKANNSKKNIGNIYATQDQMP